MNYLQGKDIQLVKFTERYITADYIGWLNDSEVNRYLGAERMPVSRDDVNIPDSDETILLAIISNHTDTPKYIGTISLHYIDWIDRKGEVGYMIGSKEHWGKGVATEAVGLITNYALNRLNHNKISAGVIEGNTGSIKVLKKNGYKQYAVAVQDYYLDGEYLDTLRFYRLSEWKI
ncbi:MAG: GNAT family N-acetyltransferase [Deltaproteobacteria bacterium]|nr:GNAT family N-acetyltransferase [Deltaproteobacteria bacterium]